MFTRLHPASVKIAYPLISVDAKSALDLSPVKRAFGAKDPAKYLFSICPFRLYRILENSDDNAAVPMLNEFELVQNGNDA